MYTEPIPRPSDPAPSALDEARLRSALVDPGPLAALEIVTRTGSTNTDLVERVRAGDVRDRSVLIAEEQTEGRGRNDRSWTAPAGTGLTFSVLLRPDGVPTSRFGWIPLLVGTALVHAVRRVTGVRAGMKWPNDLLVGRDGRKCGGILAELVNGPDPAVVVGIGINVHQCPDELPVSPNGLPTTSLAIAASTPVDRETLLIAVIEELITRDRAWRAAGGDPARGGLLAAYRGCCATIGVRIRVEFPSGEHMRGMALDVDADGRLLVRCDDGRLRAVSAGDVTHVRPEPAGTVNTTNDQRSG